MVLHDISIAGIVYPLRRPCAAVYLSTTGEFLVDGFQPTFIGRGAAPEEARLRWALAVHAAFQELHQRSSDELSEEDQRIWSLLDGLIDTAAYRQRTPVRVRQCGRVARARPYPERILWDDGTADDVSLDQVAVPEFITFREGQRLDALVVRDAATGRLLRIADVRRLPATPPPADS